MAYISATILANDRQEDGRSVLRVRFNGDAGEAPVFESTTVDGGTTAISLRQWAIGVRDRLNAIRTVATLPGLAVGQTINLAAVTPPAPTTRETWLVDYQRLRRIQAGIAAGVVPPASDDALVSDLLSRFNAAWLADF